MRLHFWAMRQAGVYEKVRALLTIRWAIMCNHVQLISLRQCESLDPCQHVSMFNASMGSGMNREICSPKFAVPKFDLELQIWDGQVTEMRC